MKWSYAYVAVGERERVSVMVGSEIWTLWTCPRSHNTVKNLHRAVLHSKHFGTTAVQSQCWSPTQIHTHTRTPILLHWIMNHWQNEQVKRKAREELKVSRMGNEGCRAERADRGKKKERELKWVQKTKAEGDAWLSEWVNGESSEVGGGERVQERVKEGSWMAWVCARTSLIWVTLSVVNPGNVEGKKINK